MSEERKTTRRNFLIGTGTAAATVGLAGCSNEKGSNQDNNEEYTPEPTDSPTPDPEVDLSLNVAKNQNVKIQPTTEASELEQIATVLNGNANVENGEFQQLQLILNGNNENAIHITPDQLANGFPVDPLHQKPGENNYQVRAKVNGQEYSSQKKTSEVKLPAGRRLDIQVPEDVQISKGLTGVDQYTTPLEWDNYTWNEPPVHTDDADRFLDKHMGFIREMPESMRAEVENAGSLSQVLDITLDPLQNYVKKAVGQNQKDGISTESSQMAVVIEEMADEIAGLQTTVWDGLMQDGASPHGIMHGYDHKTENNYLIETIEDTYNHPQESIYSENGEKGGNRSWHPIIDKYEKTNGNYKAEKKLTESMIRSMASMDGGYGRALAFTDDFLTPIRDMLRQDKIDSDKFEKAMNKLRISVQTAIDHLDQQEHRKDGGHVIAHGDPFSNGEDLKIYLETEEYDPGIPDSHREEYQPSPFEQFIQNNIYQQDVQTDTELINQELA